MAETTLTLSLSGIAMADPRNPGQNNSGQSSYALKSETLDSITLRSRLYLMFSALPNAIRTKKLIKVSFALTCVNVAGSGYAHLFSAAESFNPGSLTWNNQPTTLNAIGRARGPVSGTTTLTIPELGDSLAAAEMLAAQALYLELWPTTTSFSYICNVKTEPVIVLSVSYDPDIEIGPQVNITGGKTSGYINPRTTQTFQWRIAKNDDRYWSLAAYQSYQQTGAGYAQRSATFYWRSGSSGAYNAIPVSGDQMSVSVPANTFPTLSTIQYYVRVTETGGISSATPVYTLSTTDAETVCQALSPIGSVEDASAPILFSWAVSNPTGSLPTKSELTWTADNGQTWAPRVIINGSGTSYTYPANTFPAGEIFWSIRAYNSDGVEGPWSNGNRFIAVAAPPTPLVSTNAAPFATIRWQGEGQQAYRLTVDGTELGPFFGDDKSYTLEDYLADGPHTVSVSVQGQYGLWSQEGTVSFQVKNTPGRAVTLSGSFDRDAVLSWQTAATVSNFYVYRDGVRIGHTTGTTFIDRLVLGAHEYTVINRLADGNYTRSNTVGGLLCACVTAVAPFSGGPWVELPLSENSSSEQAYSYSRTHSLRHMSGAALPVLELSPYEDGGGRYDAAFADPAEGRALEALRGQMVIVKSRRGNVVIGVLAQMDKREKDFFTTYSFSVERAYWEDYVDDTDD